MPTGGGPTVAGYRVGELLGAGGTAAVFLATDTRDGSAVALRILHAHLAVAPDAVARFRWQAEVTRTLRHPNLVGTLDQGVDGPVVWAATELAAGPTMAEVVEHGGPLPWAEALRLVEGVVAGLAHAHAHGVLHLDLSATNVVLAERGDSRRAAVVLDLGGTMAGGPEPPGAPDVPRLVRASPHFASPEVATGAAAGPAADVYSTGCLLHLLLTGRPPFLAASPREVLQRHVDAAPRPPSAYAWDLGPDLDALVLEMVAKDPARRPTVAELASRLALLGPAAGTDPRGSATPARRRGSGTSSTPAMEPVSAGGYLPAPPVTDGSPADLARPPRRRRAAPVGLLAAVVLVAALAGPVLVQAAAGGQEPAATGLPLPPAAPSPPVDGSPAPVAVPSPSTTPSGPAVTAAPTAVVPELAGVALTEAVGALAAAALVADVVLVDGPDLAGVVVRSEPGAGTAVPGGSAVRVVVASGLTLVPDVAGREPADAAARLHEAGLVVGQGAGPTTVTATQPGAGARVDVGSAVQLLGPPAPAPTPTPTPAPTPTPSVPAPEPSPSATAGVEGARREP